MATTYRPAPSVERIAADLIVKHHVDLTGVRMEFVFRDPPSKKAGREVWGSARKVSGLNAYLAAIPVSDGGEIADLFVIEIAEPSWAGLTQRQRVALVDHELSHCRVEFDDDGKIALSLVTHDIEEFGDVVKRHGLWRDDLKAFATVVQQAFELDTPEAKA